MTDSRIAGVYRPWALAFIAAAATGIPTPVRADVTVESLTSTAVSGVGPYYQDVSDAIRKFAEKDYPGALSKLERAKKNVPRLAPAEVMMAQMYFDANQPGPAIAVLEKVIQRMPQDPEAYVMLAERAASEGRVTEADMMFEKAGKIVEAFVENPKRKQNLQLRNYAGWASVDESRSNWKDARAKLESLIKLDPHSAMAHDKMGRVLFAVDDHKGAYAEFRLAAEADKSMPRAEIAMAALFKDPLSAEKWVKAAVAKGPQDLGTQLGAARFFLKTNQLNEAKAHAEEAVKLDPDGMESNLMMGIIARLLAEYKTAEVHLSKAHLHAPANPVIVGNLALALLELPDDDSHQRALQFADLNARQNPNNAEVVATLGWINYRLNRRYEADRAFAALFNSIRSGALKHLTSDMGYYLANYLKETGQIPEAVRLLTDGLNSNELFAYRKPAQAMLAQLSKSEQPQGSKGNPPPATSKSAGTPSKAGATK